MISSNKVAGASWEVEPLVKRLVTYWIFVRTDIYPSLQSDEGGSESESEYSADTEELISEESEDDGSEFGDSDASDESASGSSFDDDDDDSGEDWDELERKAAKCKCHFLSFCEYAQLDIH